MRVFTKTITLTKAQIDALYAEDTSVPLEIIPKPGEGKAIVLVSAAFYKIAGNAATVGTGEINFSYGTSATAIMELVNVDAATGALGNNAQKRIQHGVSSSLAVVGEDLPLNISASAAIVCAANTVAKLIINFMIVDL
jgi:hypothetical protein